MIANKAQIVLTIDLDTYEEESGERLTPRRLNEIAQDVNANAAYIMGYESWSSDFVEIPT